MNRKFFKTYIKILLPVLGVVLAVYLFVSWQHYINMEKVGLTRAHILKFETELNDYIRENGYYPSDEEGLNALTEYKPRSDEPYLENIPKDAWGNKFIYKSSNNMKDYEITSYGADAKVGGSDFDADIISKLIN